MTILEIFIMFFFQDLHILVEHFSRESIVLQYKVLILAGLISGALSLVSFNVFVQAEYFTVLRALAAIVCKSSIGRTLDRENRT